MCLKSLVLMRCEHRLKSRRDRSKMRKTAQSVDPSLCQSIVRLGESRCLHTINTSKIILDHLSACWHQSSKSCVAARFIQFRLWHLLFEMQEAIVANDSTSYLGVYHIFGLGGIHCGIHGPSFRFGIITVSHCEREIFVASCLFRLMANMWCFHMFFYVSVSLHSFKRHPSNLHCTSFLQAMTNSVNQKPWLSQILVVKRL